MPDVKLSPPPPHPVLPPPTPRVMNRTREIGDGQFQRFPSFEECVGVAVDVAVGVAGGLGQEAMQVLRAAITFIL